MESLELEATHETPKIILDKQKDIIEIAGISVPEDVLKFYDPILKWLDEYILNPNEKTNVIFKLEYFNTASSKLILDILFKFKLLSENGHNVLISWYHEEDDTDMVIAAEMYAELTGLEFKYIIVDFD